MKDLFIDEYEALLAEAEESGVILDDAKAGELARKIPLQRILDNSTPND